MRPGRLIAVPFRILAIALYLTGLAVAFAMVGALGAATWLESFSCRERAARRKAREWAR